MKLPTMAEQATISLFFFVLILLHPTILNPIVHAGTNSDFPAVINFGDSNSDTGGFAATFFNPYSPNGDTYFHKSVGRFSNGRFLIDFVAEACGLPFLNPYLDSLGPNFSHGINFTEFGLPIRLPNTIYPSNGGFNPLYLELQYSQFVQFGSRSEMNRKQGNPFASLMPQDDFFQKVLYTLDIGNNDFAEVLANLTIEKFNASAPDIVNKFSANIKNLYGLGVRSYWIHNTGPIGCRPYMLTAFPSGEKDSAGCLKPHNEVAQYFNLKLKEAVAQLRNEFPSAAFTYVDIYSVEYSLFAEPQKYGFELPLVACCGYGGQYNYSNMGIVCGRTITVNGTSMFVGSCDRPSVRVVWDGIHFTEAANKFIFDQISTGSFSDPPVPPVPLKQACQRTSN